MASIVTLSPRRREVMALYVRGVPQTEIAARLSISVKTVEAHVDQARRMIGARSRLEAVHLYWQEHVAALEARLAHYEGKEIAG